MHNYFYPPISLILPNPSPHITHCQATKQVTYLPRICHSLGMYGLYITALSACRLCGHSHTSDSVYGGLGYPDDCRVVQWAELNHTLSGKFVSAKIEYRVVIWSGLQILCVCLSVVIFSQHKCTMSKLKLNVKLCRLNYFQYLCCHSFLRKKR